jgi:F0F1-type ATP synthase membrane subunit b/b'
MMNNSALAVADVQYDQDLRAVQKQFNEDVENMRKDMEAQTNAALEEVKKKHVRNTVVICV